jgi:hypothetical protein
LHSGLPRGKRMDYDCRSARSRYSKKKHEGCSGVTHIPE